MLLLLSCQSSKPSSVNLPTINYPKFPIDTNDSSISVSMIDDDNVCIKYLNTNKSVTIPLWFWLDLVTYAVEVDMSISQYEAIQEILLDVQK